jgi:hypothetical protein
METQIPFGLALDLLFGASVQLSSLLLDIYAHLIRASPCMSGLSHIRTGDPRTPRKQMSALSSSIGNPWIIVTPNTC